MQNIHMAGQWYQMVRVVFILFKGFMKKEEDVDDEKRITLFVHVLQDRQRRCSMAAVDGHFKLFVFHQFMQFCFSSSGAVFSLSLVVSKNIVVELLTRSSILPVSHPMTTNKITNNDKNTRFFFYMKFSAFTCRGKRVG